MVNRQKKALGWVGTVKTGYSGSIPAMRITLPHLTISEEIKLANSLGELPTGSKPR